MHIIRKHELTTKPWKNGGGVTREIASATYNSRPVFRLSMADVSQGGPFSDFSGLTRVLTVIEGGAMRLHADGRVFDADLWRPVEFDGALKMTAELVDQPLTDFNLMFDPELCDGSVDVLKGGCTHSLPANGTQVRAVHVLAGDVGIDSKTTLNLGDTVLLTKQGSVLLLPDDAAIMLILIDLADKVTQQSLEFNLR
ncbi:HutD family protein [Sulfitobacter sp.]|jgi:environmental stress-induced protein Ves|uniref:HutD/Ves family protein n=1 Tax=Sulfitobacter sp. TaxID=1903071 RepID=UPI0039E3BCA6